MHYLSFTYEAYFMTSFDNLKAKSDEDLMSILTRVTRFVVEKESISNVTKKQVQLRQETLTWKIYLKNGLNCGNSTLNQESTTTHIPMDQEFSRSSILTKKSYWFPWLSCKGYKRSNGR